MMKQIHLGGTQTLVPAIAMGCMRISAMTDAEADAYVQSCVEQGAHFFDHADIYGAGECERVFGRVLHHRPALREQLFLQSKCGIVPGKMFDFSYQHIIDSVEGILARLQTDRLDMLLLHRPDALVEPAEVARAFDDLHRQGKVLRFGVSNMNPMQIALLRRDVKQPLLANQLQFSIPVATMVSAGMEVNMTTDGATGRDGSVLDYCRLHDITIQAWSPFQRPNWGGPFIGSAEDEALNAALSDIAEQHHATPTAVATAWILRHPARMQVVCGSTNPGRIREIIGACDLTLSREEWYRLYLAAGHILP